MPDRAGSRTPEAPRERGAGEPILSGVGDDRRAYARSLRPAKLGASLGRSGPAWYDGTSEETCLGDMGTGDADARCGTDARNGHLSFERATPRLTARRRRAGSLCRIW
jgi:hypothetical protein